MTEGSAFVCPLAGPALPSRWEHSASTRFLHPTPDRLDRDAVLVSKQLRCSVGLGGCQAVGIGNPPIELLGIGPVWPTNRRSARSGDPNRLRVIVQRDDVNLGAVASEAERAVKLAGTEFTKG
jgi:hypothetical protein